MFTAWKTGSLIALLFTLCACASTTSAVRVDKAEDVDLTKCRSFDWLQPGDAPASFTDQRVRAAALAELERKGYTLSAENPDCRISYVLSMYERPAQKPRIGVGAGGGSGGIGGGIGVSLPVGRRGGQSSTLTLDIVDVASNRQIWSGAIDSALSEKELTEDEARALTQDILAQFPSRK
jgi:hypothetical protein